MTVLRDQPGIPSATQLADWVRDARRRTLDLLDDLTDEQLRVPRLEIVNPLLWELGHVGWFQEKWALRDLYGRPSLREHSDALYDSTAIPHDPRWDLPLFGRGGTMSYLRDVQEAVLELLATRQLTPELAYFVMLTVFHEDMHGEAFAYTRQTLAYPAPPCWVARPESSKGVASTARPSKTQGVPPATSEGGPLSGDVAIPGGTFRLGAERSEPFVFDNEKWAHMVEVKPFAIARTAVTQLDFASFVDDGGYRRRDLWSEAGWRWRESAAADMPVYWRKTGPGRERRDFDSWVPLELNLPVCHVNWYEAEAYCRWARRRLPTEAEWEVAAAGEAHNGVLSEHKRRFPWGDEPPTTDRANLDGSAGGRAAVGAFAAGDSAFGCRQMIGNVWEWTASTFLPYPGFEADPYKEYSQPWFGTHKVLRGGCWLTPGRLLRNTWRNFYLSERRDIWAGFRTCAL